ncbi:EAL domain-containing protein [Saccharopolyspora sp. NPDC049426]|uniref:putative bifunctional diguanylate cyclase/phosphodiesterase n=1 Tax=Saccharopolyspora sp. NPDC049426 TaxID=3155652 RepID=UPI003442E004
MSPEQEEVDRGVVMSGSRMDRAMLDLTLAIHGAVAWRYRFADDTLTWFGDGLGQLLSIPDASAESLRARLRELLEPVIVSAATASAWREFELEQPFEDHHGVHHRLCIRARPTGQRHPEELIGIATDAHPGGEEVRQLAVLADRYRLLAELSPDAICVHQNGLLTYVNPATVRLVRAESDEQLLGHPISEFVAEPSLGDLRRRVAGLTEPGMASEPTEVRLRCVDGDTVLIESVSVRTEWNGHPAFQVLMHDITAQRRAEQALHEQATHDDLTGLLNRRGMNEILTWLTSGESKQLGLVFCDIDNFKRINDSLGHEAGDELLIALARQLSASVPPECTVGRLSGDEFLVITADLDAVGGLQALTRRISEALRIMVPIRDQMVSVSASTGGALLTGSMTGQDLLRYADVAMFHAKSRGPGRISLADSEIVSAAEGQLQLEGELRQAIHSDALTLHYQPIVGRDGAIVAGEALLRWPHPERGELGPGVILAAAEQGDLMRELDQWVLRTALAEASRWPSCDGAPPSVAVNLGGLLPGDPSFLDVVTEIITDSGLAFDRVVLEVVETALVDLSPQTHQAMTDLAKLGVRFALDDFGTGYSTLSRLKQLPVHILKLDRTFVAKIDTDQVDHAIARAIVTMTHAMDRICVAEGVETHEQHQVLQSLEVDQYQGYLLARPQPAAAFLDHLATRR